MSFETKISERDQLAQYEELKRKAAQIVSQTTQWMVDATNLHKATGDSGEKSEVIAVRDQLVADLRQALGV